MSLNRAQPATRVLIVTGGSRGIGRQIAMLAARQGWQVAIGYHRHLPRIESHDPAYHAIHAFELDVRNSASQQAFFDRVRSTLGCPFGLVTSAGIDMGAMPVDSIRQDDATEMFAVNTIGLIASCAQFTRHAALSRGGQGGVIVNISSMAATIGGRKHKSVYAATKAAVDAFSVGAAKELAIEGIRVFSVRPGVTRTDMTSAMLDDAQTARAIRATIACGQEAQVNEIAEPVVDLLSGRFAYASGSMINLAGGGFIL